MNYRHIYHAGNFADVLKHIVLVLCLDYLQKKDGGLCLIDAHGGAGLYALDSEEAAKTGEWERGIGRLLGRADAPAGLRLYLDLIQPDLDARRYPGSPLIMAKHLRGQDRLIAAELHEPTFEALQAALTPYKQARVLHADAYECLRAHIPPKERRGLALIDPPFELKDEFQTLGLADAGVEKALGHGRFPVVVSDQGASAGGGAERGGRGAWAAADLGSGGAHSAAGPPREPERLRRDPVQRALYRARAGRGAPALPQGSHGASRSAVRLARPGS